MKALHNGLSMRVGVLVGGLCLFSGTVMGQDSAGAAPAPAPAPAAPADTGSSSATPGTPSSSGSPHKKKHKHKSSTSSTAPGSTAAPATGGGASSSSMTSSWPSLVSHPSTGTSDTGTAAAAAAAVAVPAASAPAPATFPKAASEKPAEPLARSVALPADNTPVNPADENAVIAKLDRLGYLYYNSYETEPDGGATIRALERTSGALLTLHLDRTGKMTSEPGWKQ